MIINQKNSTYLKKIENRLGKNNLFSSRYLAIKIDGNHGFFSLFIRQLGWIDYALRNDLIPVVDMQTGKSIFLKDKEVGKINAYEYYFEQPCSVSLEQALKEGKVRYAWGHNPPYFPNDSIDFLYNREIVEYYSKLAKRYMPFKKEIANILSEEKERLFPKECRILGVLARGTDYTMLKPYFHPVQPTIEMIICEVNKYRKKYDCDKIYVATEDQNNLDILKREYGKDLIYIDQPRLKKVETYLNEDKIFTQRIPYQIGLDTLKSIYLLSKCNGLVGGRTSGTVGAMVLSSGYEFINIFTLGRYGLEEDFIEQSKSMNLL